MKYQYFRRMEACFRALWAKVRLFLSYISENSAVHPLRAWVRGFSPSRPSLTLPLLSEPTCDPGRTSPSMCSSVYPVIRGLWAGLTLMSRKAQAVCWNALHLALFPLKEIIQGNIGLSRKRGVKFVVRLLSWVSKEAFQYGGLGS